MTFGRSDCRGEAARSIDETVHLIAVYGQATAVWLRDGNALAPSAQICDRKSQPNVRV
jgi:hypothetical protein